MHKPDMEVAALLAIIACVIKTSCANVEVGLGNIRHDTIGGDVVVEFGQIPRWLDGSFYRLSCGAFGETGSENENVNKVNHLFDCLPVGQSYRFEDGRVTFNQRYFDSGATDLWRAYDMNMNDSLVFWRTIYANFDYERQQILEPIIRYIGKIERFPEVTLWQMGDNVFSHSEYDNVAQLYPHDMENEVNYHQFDDNNFGYTHEIIIDEDAHEVQEADGTLYCTHMVYQFDQYGALHQWKNVFKVENNVRSTVARIPYPDINLGACFQNGTPGIVYPIMAHRQGYIHSIAMTENYIIVPESSYLIDLCALFINVRPDLPYFSHFFTWEPDEPSRIWVIRKSDGRVMANMTTEAVFITHQFNAYESNGAIYLDMVTYNDSSAYTHSTYVRNMIREGFRPHDVHRYAIDTSDWSLRRSNLLPGVTDVEFPNINQDYLGQPYTYAWAGLNIYGPNINSLAKINVQAGMVEHQYDFARGFYAFEPWFVKTPGGSAEDDGVIMVQGLDSVQEKGFLMIFDARDLRLISHVTGSDLVLFGLHNKYFASHIGALDSSTNARPVTDGATHWTISYSLLTVIGLYLL